MGTTARKGSKIDIESVPGPQRHRRSRRPVECGIERDAAPQAQPSAHGRIGGKLSKAMLGVNKKIRPGRGSLKKFEVVMHHADLVAGDDLNIRLGGGVLPEHIHRVVIRSIIPDEHLQMWTVSPEDTPPHQEPQICLPVVG